MGSLYTPIHLTAYGACCKEMDQMVHLTCKDKMYTIICIVYHVSSSLFKPHFHFEKKKTMCYNLRQCHVKGRVFKLFIDSGGSQSTQASRHLLRSERIGWEKTVFESPQTSSSEPVGSVRVCQFCLFLFQGLVHLLLYSFIFL